MDASVSLITSERNCDWDVAQMAQITGTSQSLVFFLPPGTFLYIQVDRKKEPFLKKGAIFPITHTSFIASHAPF